MQFPKYQRLFGRDILMAMLIRILRGVKGGDVIGDLVDVVIDDCDDAGDTSESGTACDDGESRDFKSEVVGVSGNNGDVDAGGDNGGVDAGSDTDVVDGFCVVFAVLVVVEVVTA